ncbi:GspH/FimT family pseudopilin [Marinobacterium sp. D7]|uniref:GspH/FimT family pseudopilin n=1 Tax=Marinobacterium ramblicola TaxID=2849041 RepID=UPI001C2DD5D5|nr:GspH/FimT family pseudopilin [Marinobacterium ramblicola]MBV1790123.1 GspH/FimT family pseudopilin [Marinobacterium ramblicola]
MTRYSPNTSRHAGFTLLELMVSLAILAILLGIGIPSFQSFIQNSQLNASKEGLESALYLARSEAVTRRSSITVCRRNSSGSACENSGSWDSGWLATDKDSTVLRTWDAPSGDTTLNIAGGTTITFTADGWVEGNSAYSFTISGGGSSCSLSVSPIGTLSTAGC